MQSNTSIRPSFYHGIAGHCVTNLTVQKRAATIAKQAVENIVGMT